MDLSGPAPAGKNPRLQADPMVADRQCEHLHARARTHEGGRSGQKVNRGQMQYAEKFVAFVDILGFSVLVRESVTPTGKIGLKQLLQALEHPNPAGPDQIVVGRIGDISKSGHQMSYFSDSVAISTDPTEAGLFHLVNHVERIALGLLKLGFLCRGAVTKGLLYHRGNIVVGPALVEAYDLEKNRAKTPRIIVTDEIADAAFGYAEPVGSLFKGMFCKDEDRSRIVNILRTFNYHVDAAIQGTPLPTWLTDIQHWLADEILRLRNAQKEKECRYVESFKRHFDLMLQPIDELRQPVSR